MKIKLMFAWFDIWIGVYIDRKKRTIYIAIVPMLIIVVIWRDKNIYLHKKTEILNGLEHCLKCGGVRNIQK